MPHATKFLVTLFLCFANLVAPTAAQTDSPAKGTTKSADTETAPENQLVVAREQLDAARKAAVDEMLSQFDKQVGVLKPKKTAHAQAIALLEGERRTFETAGTMPRSPSMDKARARFEREWSQARRNYRKTVKATAAELLRLGKADEAKQALLDLEGNCPFMIDPRDFAARMERTSKELDLAIQPRNSNRHTKEIRDSVKRTVEEARQGWLTAEELHIRIKRLIADIDGSQPLQQPTPNNEGTVAPLRATQTLLQGLLEDKKQ